MHRERSHPPALVAVAWLLAGLLAWSIPGFAQSTSLGNSVTGQASAVQATILGAPGIGSTNALANTGTLTDNQDAKDASRLKGSIPSLLTAEVLSAATIGYPNEVDSEASLGNLSLTVAGVTITADSVIAQSSKTSGAAGTGNSYINNLAINGALVSISGEPNQTVAIPGGSMVINEQTVTSTGSFVVNAIHVTVHGVADIVIASATAGVA